MNKENENYPMEVFSGSIGEAEFVRSLLENAEIETFLKDENVGTLAPWQTAGGGVGAVKVIVGCLDYENAKLVIDEYEKNTNK